jgi:N-acetylneuraminate synthase
MSITIIGEIGINANGEVGNAKKLIAMAKECGCDAVKFQKRTIDVVYTKEFLDGLRDSPWGKTQRDQKKGLEFGQAEYEQIDAYCKEIGMDWFASAWDVGSLTFLRQFNLRYNKIASAMLVDREIVRLVAEQRVHTFVSTGMSDESLLDEVVTVFLDHQCPFELMHCVGAYPCPDDCVNLRRIETLRQRYGVGVGYSGHETGLAISLAAVGMGISSIERHITLDRTMYGSDQAASLEPNGLRNLVASIRKIEQAMGSGRLEMNPIEAPIAKKLRERYEAVK